MLKQPCYFYNTTGKCRFGKHCRFLHELETQIKVEYHQSHQDEIPVISKQSRSFSSNTSTSTGKNTTHQNEGISKENVESNPLQRYICRFYSSNQFCRYGKKCRFEHVRFPQKQSETKPGGDDLKDTSHVDQDQMQNEGKDESRKEESKPETWKEDEVQDGKILNESKISSKKSYNRNVCRFFKAGYCQFGKRCRFYHPNMEPIDGVDVGKPNRTGIKRDSREPTKPNVIRVYKRNEISGEQLSELRQTEITQLKRRFPSDRLKVGEKDNGNESFIFSFTPSDPDWPFDVRTFEIQVDFPEDYPLKLFTLSLPADQDLPEIVRKYMERSLGEWTTKQQKDSERNETVQLLFRPFLRWLDKDIEDIVTEGLKQFRRELQAEAAGIQFISAKELKKNFDNNKSESDEDQLESTPEDDLDKPEVIVYRKSELDTEEVYRVPNKADSVDSTDDESDELNDGDGDSNGEGETDGTNTAVHKRPQINLDTERRGTEMAFRNAQIWYCTTILMEKLHLSIRCERCKNPADFSTPPNRANSLECAKCNNPMLVAFRAALVHSYSSTFGYLDLDGCTAFDVILQDCHFSMGCIVCSRDALIKKITPGKTMEVRCRGCHNMMKFATDSVKLTVLDTSGGVDTSLYSGNIHKVNIKKLKRPPKDAAIQEGKPLPDNGSCKHYKKSFRWLRFPCCGKTYPCDLCHDDKEDHEMIRANRMICGFCCREQPFAAERPCLGCGGALTKVHTSHWEGGKGCRDKMSMSRNDDRKYTSLNKTVSNKAQALKDKNKKKKSTTKLSTSKAAQK